VFETEESQSPFPKTTAKRSRDRSKIASKRAYRGCPDRAHGCRLAPRGSPRDVVPNLTMTESPPNLDITVPRLKALSRGLSNNAPRKIADVYLAGIGLLCHLKDDQATLHRIRYVIRNRNQRDRIRKYARVNRK